MRETLQLGIPRRCCDRVVTSVVVVEIDSKTPNCFFVFADEEKRKFQSCKILNERYVIKYLRDSYTRLYSKGGAFSPRLFYLHVII